MGVREPAVVASRASSSSRAALVALYLGVALLTLAGYEAYLRLASPVRGKVTYSLDYGVLDELLGKKPQPNVSVRATKRYGPRVAYDVVYTVGANGLRLGPPDAGAAASACVLFFGCSYTYGEGVNDAETTAYRVGVLSQGRARTYNFGFHGYGPHQMLAILERGNPRASTDCQPTHVIYQAIPDHVRRVAGLPSFDRHGPRYRLDAAGRPIWAGHFDDDPTFAERWKGTFLLEQLRKSRTAQRLLDRERSLTDEDFALYGAIVGRSRELASARFPGVRFSVLLWRGVGITGDAELYEKVRAVLEAGRFDVLEVEEILPGFEDDEARYRIARDLHPNPRAYDTVARYVVDEILGLD